MLDEIHSDIAVIEQALFRLGRNLKAIKDKRLYFCGGFSTFQDFCAKELGHTRQQAYRLILAHDVMQDLLVQGVPMEELPQSERLCREIRVLSPEKQAKVWKAVMRVAKEAKRPPTIADVQAEAIKEEKPNEILQRQQTELLRKFESASVVLKTAVAFDLLEPPFRFRLAAVLTEIAETVQILIRSLKSSAVEKRADEEK
jgi:hypothetical protein